MAVGSGLADGSSSARASATPPHGGGVGGREAVRLLRMYESVIAVRPLQGGNRDFLESMLVACRAIGAALAAAPDGVPPAPAAEIEAWLAVQDPDNARTTAGEIVKLVDRLGVDGDAAGEPLYLEDLPELRPRYDAITVVFGPGIGLGD